MKTIRLLLALLGAAALALSARAIEISVDTSSLLGHPDGSFYLDFQLNDGTGLGDGNNTAVLSNFRFNGGAVFGTATSFGGVSGDLASSVTLTDTDPFNEFFQAFTPGGLLQFDLGLTNHGGGPVPDGFGFAILDSNLFNLGTYAPGSDQFLTVDVDGGALVYRTYAGVGGVPEPHVPEAGGTALLVAVALLSMGAAHRRLPSRIGPAA